MNHNNSTRSSSSLPENWVKYMLVHATINMDGCQTIIISMECCTWLNMQHICFYFIPPTLSEILPRVNPTLSNPCENYIRALVEMEQSALYNMQQVRTVFWCDINPKLDMVETFYVRESLHLWTTYRFVYEVELVQSSLDALTVLDNCIVVCVHNFLVSFVNPTQVYI